MTSLVQFRNSDVYFNSAYLDESTVDALLTADKLSTIDGPETPALTLDPGIVGKKNAAFEQAWIWMTADPEIAQVIDKSGMTKERLSAEVQRKLDGPVDQAVHEAAINFANEQRHELIEENEITVFKVSGVSVLEIGPEAKVAMDPRIPLLIALVMDLLALVFAAFSIYANYNVATVEKKVGTLAPRMVGKVGPEIENAAKMVVDLMPEIEKGKCLDKACSAVYMATTGVSGLLKTAANTALSTMSLGDWAIAVGTLLASIAAILLTEGLALVAKVAECILSLIAVLQDIIAFANA